MRLLLLYVWLEDGSEEELLLVGKVKLADECDPDEGTSSRVRWLDAGEVVADGMGDGAGTSGAETGPDLGKPSQIP
jgi:hypothetical protein